MGDDPYKLLGVAKDASQDDIRKAYRKLAKELHPDLNPGDKNAEERFKKVSAAHALLSDPDTRARFDRGEIDADGAERPPEQPFYRRYAEGEGGRRYASSAGYEDFEDISDVFADLFGRRGAGPGSTGGGPGGFRVRAKGADARYRLEVSFLDAAAGAKRRITLPEGGSIDLTIPAGVEDGAALRLKGKGGPGLNGGEPGDALVEVGVAPHPLFTREGDDVLLELPVTIDEAVLGAKVEVPTVSGLVRLNVPKGSNTGDVLRLRGKGIKPGGRPAGDQRVTLKVVLPERPDRELEEFLRSWRERHRYDPRAGMRGLA